MSTSNRRRTWDVGSTILRGDDMYEDFVDNWTHEDIREYYDNNPNLTLLTLAGMLGLTVPEVKEILMGGNHEQ